MRNMKLFNILTTVIAATLLSCSPKHNSYLIKGEFEGIPDNTKIELIPGATMKEEKPVLVTEVVNGVFTFKDTVPEPRFFYIRIADGGGYLPVMVENCKIFIKGKPTVKTYDKDRFYQFDDVTVSGSASHDLYIKEMRFHRQLDSLYEANNKLSEVISRKVQDARKANDKEAIDSLSMTDEYKAMADRENAFFKKVDEDIRNKVLANKGTWLGPLLLLNNMSYFTDEQRDWYNQFPKEIQESYYGRIVNENLPRESWEGKQGADFVATREDGTKVSFSDLLKGHKYVLLDFWASWCNPCRKEIPNLRNLYKEYGSKGFTIVSISIDKDANAWKSAVKQNKLVWENFLDTDGSIADAYKVKLIPNIFLIDNTGKIVLDNKIGEELSSNLKELMK
jgi:thiol-disulfide isomerase/thioredoxin